MCVDLFIHLVVSFGRRIGKSIEKLSTGAIRMADLKTTFFSLGSINRGNLLIKPGQKVLE